MRPAPEFGVFYSVLPLAYHGAVVALRVCVPPETTRVHCVWYTLKHLSLQVRCHLRYTHCRLRSPTGREAVLPRKTLHLFPISLTLNV